MLSLVTTGVSTLRRVCAEPLDVSGTHNLPDWLAAFKSQDGIAFPLHALTGSMLRRAGCDPRAIGLQWLKGAYHAQTPAELDEAADGLNQAARSLGSATGLGETLCPYISSDMKGARQQVVADRVGLQCPPGSA